MKSRLGESFELLPDTIQVANAVLILVFIPLFEYVIYPLLSKTSIKHFTFNLSKFINVEIQNDGHSQPQPQTTFKFDLCSVTKLPGVDRVAKKGGGEVVS
jgi:hypothetical protein